MECKFDLRPSTQRGWLERRGVACVVPHVSAVAEMSVWNDDSIAH